MQMISGMGYRCPDYIANYGKSWLTSPRLQFEGVVSSFYDNKYKVHERGLIEHCLEDPRHSINGLTLISIRSYLVRL